jgi:hypothetical protein
MMSCSHFEYTRAVANTTVEKFWTTFRGDEQIYLTILIPNDNVGAGLAEEDNEDARRNCRLRYGAYNYPCADNSAEMQDAYKGYGSDYDCSHNCSRDNH